MAQISGYLQEASAKVLVIREDTWAVETSQDVTLGSYEITGLVAGKKAIVAVSAEGEVSGFGNVDTVTEPA